MHFKILIKHFPLYIKVDPSWNLKTQIACQFHNFHLKSPKEMEILGATDNASTSQLLHGLGAVIMR